MSLSSASGSEGWGILFAGARHPRARPSAASVFPLRLALVSRVPSALPRTNPSSGPLLPVLSHLEGPSGLQGSQGDPWNQRLPILGRQRALLAHRSSHKVLLMSSQLPLLPMAPCPLPSAVTVICPPFSIIQIHHVNRPPSLAFPLPLPAPSTFLGSSSDPTLLHPHAFCLSNLLSLHIVLLLGI